MQRLKHCMIIGIFFVVIAGALAHFLYEWTGNNFAIGLFTPINESVWEHMKLIFFPMLLYSFGGILKLRKEYPCIDSALCFGILTGTILIPIFFYTYTGFLGRNMLALDIGTFVLSIIIAFFAAYKFTLSCRLKFYTFLLYGLMFLFFICFMVFTYHTPDMKIFVDLEKV